MNARPVLVAPVGGFPAAVLASLLRRQLAAGVQAPPEAVEALRATLAALEAAAGQWRGWRAGLAEDAAAEASALARTAGAGAEAGAGSGPLVICTDEAAVLLGVSASRVRQRCRAGELGARRAAGRWWCRRDLVLAERVDR